MNGNQWNNPAINPVGNNGMSYFNNNPTSMNFMITKMMMSLCIIIPGMIVIVEMADILIKG